MHTEHSKTRFDRGCLSASASDGCRSSSRPAMTLSEFSTALIRARRWALVVYSGTAVTFMLLIVCVGYIWFPDIQKLTLVFREPPRPVGDDGTYGAIVGLLIGTLFLVPSLVLPLWFVVIADRRLGTRCPVCGSSLTLWKRGDNVLRTGSCTKCMAAVLESDVAMNEDERIRL